MTESLGTRLRVAREAKGLTVEQLATLTKINPAFIQALEDGRWDLLPGRMYLKPFAKLCGEALDIDIKEIYERIDGIAPEETKTPEQLVVTSIPLTKKGIDYKLPMVLGALLIVIVLIAFAVKTNKMDFDNFDKESVVPARGFVRRNDAKWEKPWEMPAVNPAMVRGQRLRIEADAATWTCVIADIDTVFAGIMQAASGKTFTADSMFHVTLTRNDQVAAYFNGVKVSEIGSSPRRLNNLLIKPQIEDESSPDEIR